MTVQFIPETHSYIVSGVRYPSVTQILKDEGFIDDTWFTEESRRRGNQVHLITRLYDEGTADEWEFDPAIYPYLEGWKRFLRESGFRPEIIERPYGSTVYRFAGTPDRIGILNGESAIMDIKSGAVQDWTALQTVGYEILHGRYAARFGVHLFDNGRYQLTPFTDRDDRGVFLAALSTWYWKANRFKRRAA